MTPKRLFYALSALCAIMVIGIGGLAFIGNKFLSAEASKISNARADEELIEQRKILKGELEKTIDDYAELKTLATKFLPDSKNQDDLVAEFYKIANDNDIEITGMTFTASGDKLGGTSQTIPLKDAKNVLVFPFTVTNYNASFNQLISFLQDLENNRRKLQITQIRLQPDEKTGLISVPAMAVESYIKGVTPVKSQQQILKQLKTLIRTALRFRIVLTFVAAGILFVYVIQSISGFAATEANQDRINEGLSSIKRTKFDEKAVEKIQSLKDNGVDIQPDLPDNRNNPF